MRALPEFRSFPIGLIAVYIVFAIGLATGGFLYYDHQKKQITEDKQSELTAVSQLKINEISRWIKERKGDGQVILENPMIGRHVHELIENPGDSLLVDETSSWMQSLKDHYDYSSVLLTDPGGGVILSVPEKGRINRALIQYLPKAITSKKPLFYDLLIDAQQSDDSKILGCGLLVPIVADELPGSTVVGVLILKIDPFKFLYPLVQSWPTPTHTAESLLVRREGDSVVYLNELRHNRIPLLSLRLDVHDSQLPAAQAVQGHEGVFKGIDYRGVPVLSVLRDVPESPWFLVTKIDQDEIYSSIRRRGLPVALLSVILIISAGISLFLVWYYQRAQFYKKQYELEAQRLELVERYELLTRYANDNIMLADKQGRIKEVNERAVASYGYTRDEFVRLNVRDIRAPECMGDLDGQWLKIQTENGYLFETMHRRKDGSSFPVEVSARMIQLGGEGYYWGTIRDITERKQAEEALRRARDELELRVAERTAELTQVNEQLRSEVAERTLAEEALRESESKLRLLSSRLITIQEEERRRIARELHDSIGSSLSAIKFGLENNIEPVKAIPALHESLITLISLSQQTIDEVRRIMVDLRPSMLDDLGLVATIGWFCRQFHMVYPNICVEDQIGVAEEEIPEHLKIVIFRVAQEAFNNIAKYSRAELVSLELDKIDGLITLSIEDSGEGFDLGGAPPVSNQLKGLGLTSMRERTELSGGTFAIESVIGEGTLIRAVWSCA